VSDKTYDVCLVVVEKYITVKAASIAAAKEKALDSVEEPILCHHCTGELDSCGPYVVRVAELK